MRARVPLDVPTVAMLQADLDLLRQRAVWMAAELGGETRAVAVDGEVGGTLLPDLRMPSWGVALPSGDVAALNRGLRAGTPALLARRATGHLLLDLRTVPPTQDAELVDLVLAASG